MISKIQIFIYSVVCRLNPARFSSIKNDNRKTTPYKLVFFCGKNGIEYLNASMVSVFKSWDTIPEIIIVSDGTDPEIIKRKLIKWPRSLEIVTWKDSAENFSGTGKEHLYEYAAKNIWGKKFIGICYFAQKYPILYSDTDILWFKPPVLKDVTNKTVVKMCQDVGHFYSELLLNALKQNQVLNNIPFNAGLIYANGNFSQFPQWEELCAYLASYPDHRTEQTSFALFNNYFNPQEYFGPQEIFIQIDDMNSLKYTKTKNPSIWARHYVNLKNTSFWRDFVYMLFGK